MATGSISSEKIDLLIYGPGRPILQNGFSDQFVLHAAETKHDLERLAAVLERAACVTLACPHYGDAVIEPYLLHRISTVTDAPTALGQRRLHLSAVAAVE